MRKFLIILELILSVLFSKVIYSQGEKWNVNEKRIVTLMQQKKYNEAIEITKETEEYVKKTYPTNQEMACVISIFYARNYLNLKNYDQAEIFYLKTLNILEKLEKRNSNEYKGIAEEIIKLYKFRFQTAYQKNILDQAESYCKKLIEFQNKLYGMDSPESANSRGSLGLIYKNQGKYKLAEQTYLSALNDLKKGNNQKDLSVLLNNYAELLQVKGEYEKALNYLIQSRKIKTELFGENSKEVGQSLNNIGDIFNELGNYAEAEQIFELSQKIFQSKENSLLDLSKAFNGLGISKRNIGKSLEAENLLLKATKIYEDSLKNDVLLYSKYLNNLALIYEDRDDYSEAEEIYNKVIAIKRKNQVYNLDLAKTLNNTAVLKFKQEKYAEAEKYLKESQQIFEKILTLSHPSIATVMDNMAVIYFYMKKYDQAEPLLKQALDIRMKILGPNHPDYINSLNNLAVLFLSQERYSESEKLLDKSIDVLSNKIEKIFSYSSENDKLAFIDLVQYNFHLYYNFVLKYIDKNPQISYKLYNLILFQKGITVSSISKMVRLIIESKDDRAIYLMNSLKEKREVLVRMYNEPIQNPEQYIKDIEKVEKESENIEKELFNRSSIYRKSNEKLSWDKIQKKLKSDEAAIEFATFRLYKNKITDTVYYVALILTPETRDYPSVVMLGTENELNNSLINYNILIQENPLKINSQNQNNTYNFIWAPLEKYLSKSKKVYVSPDGELNLLNFNVFVDNEGKYLADKYDIRYVSSTRDIIEATDIRSNDNHSVLIGNPLFSLKKDKIELLNKIDNLNSNNDKPLSVRNFNRSKKNNFDINVLNELPGTKVEIEDISKILKSKNFVVESYMNEKATEDVVKNLSSPRLLHIATHGYFFPMENIDYNKIFSINRVDEKKISLKRENSMLRSCLFFTPTLSENNQKEGNDGILTAFEALSLDLHKTDLVVLSACESGIGDIKSGEGVFGLRRAFQIAGSEAIVMSLWKVADKESQELMALFYNNWLNGSDKYSAFREAQRTMRERIKQKFGEERPYYWGAFVIFGR